LGPKGSKKEYRKATPPLRLVFPVLVLGFYLLLWHVAPEKTVAALEKSIGVFRHILLPICLVFLLMIGLNLFLKPPHVAKILGKRSNFQTKLLCAVAGVISAGPIYAWYPLLRDLREKGAAYSLIAVFLVNRSVKLFLLPIMISFFGWTYVAILTFLTVAGSFGVGFVVGALADSPNQSRQNSED
jgi:uncharacterized membrane protein YraQ (UPF0718 family)